MPHNVCGLNLRRVSRGNAGDVWAFADPAIGILTGRSRGSAVGRSVTGAAARSSLARTACSLTDRIDRWKASFRLPVALTALGAVGDGEATAPFSATGRIARLPFSVNDRSTLGVDFEQHCIGTLQAQSKPLADGASSTVTSKRIAFDCHRRRPLDLRVSSAFIAWPDSRDASIRHRAICGARRNTATGALDRRASVEIISNLHRCVRSDFSLVRPTKFPAPATKIPCSNFRIFFG